MKKFVVSKQSVYLFYQHLDDIRGQKCRYTLYKIDMDEDSTTPPDPILDIASPILEIRRPVAVRRMKCVRLGSKLYFLGGTRDANLPLYGYQNYKNMDAFPRDVYVFDLLTNAYKKMDVCLNAGKPEPSIVFTVNGKLYALGSIPDVSSEDLHGMKLFECFNPSTNKWQVLDNLPQVGKDWFRRPYTLGIEWLECTVLPKRQQVVLLGREYTVLGEKNGSSALTAPVKFVYHLQQNEWTRHLLSKYEKFCLVEGYDDDYLYGLSRSGPPLKTKSDNICPLDVDSLFRGCQVVDAACLSIGEPVREKSVSRLSKWVLNFFSSPKSSYNMARFLHHLGDGYFSCIAAETLDHFEKDTYTITITLFKEIKGEKQPSFEAQILRCQKYAISTPGDLSATELVTCFVVNSGELQKKLKKKKGKKKKKVQSAFETISG